MRIYSSGCVLLLTVVVGLLSFGSQNASAFYVSVDGTTSANIPRSNPPFDTKTVNTGQLAQNTTSGSISSALTFQCFPPGSCPPDSNGSAQMGFQGTATLGMLSGSASGSASASGSTAFVIANYGGNGTLTCQD